ncbi:CHAD domain-containing protein [Aliifodinibius sp. S!AR15-10]|uniref:CHAD domain-containing protein n=1 Tax=Aliifodinibius sp. S!AR15-10 TaxID=2950437 RepID=UPI00285C2698|nr:CHAD domain-containing protein [Aliifodinibius sp. S!AR15-10]MDR8390449.1 CHAD domain-containing protein [Aliifodinibius sp. S!AR15-10]
MSIQLHYTEDLSQGVKRLMIQECNKALDYLDNASGEEQRHEAVHEARKAFKKNRACLRLVRDQIDYYEEENAWFRDRGREISDIRDATSSLEVLERLQEQFDSHLYENAFNAIEKQLRSYRKELAKKVFNQEKRLESIQEALKKKLETIPCWPLKIQSFDELRPSIKRTYKRGCKGLQRSLEQGNVEDFHEWRKRAKYLRYQIDVLNRIWPPVLETLEDELHAVTDFIGTLNDLDTLQHIIQKMDRPFDNREEEMMFNALLEKQQCIMKEHALLKGRKFYCDSPSDFCDRLEVYWETHHQEIENEKLPQPEPLEYS